MKNNEALFRFFSGLHIENSLPDDIEILNPYKEATVLKLNKEFYDTYYNDTNPRILLLGINPGRFGAGITGIPFTDPIVLEDNLKIKNNLQKKPELSATFIHEVIKAFGGPIEFYNNFLVTAVSPLGFIKNGININYYDKNDLESAVEPFIIKSLKTQYEITQRQHVCVSIGQGKNINYLKQLNRKIKLFKEIIPLGHPRWIMQYKRKEIKKYISQYVDVLNYIKI